MANINLDPQSIATWINVGTQLVTAGVASVEKIKEMIRNNHPGATEQQLNEIAEAVRQDAIKRKDVADKDSGKTGGVPSASPAKPQIPPQK